jgi:peptide/nickel transport system permease protein
VIRRALLRLLTCLAVVWLVLTATFLMHHVLPSDPARAVAGPQARPTDVERIRHRLGLDRPLGAQYARFFGRLLHLGPSSPAAKDPEHGSCSAFGPVHVDLGMSFQRRKPVGKLLGERLPRTALLAVAAVGVQVWLGVLAGVIAALRRGKMLDHGLIVLTLVGVSTPTFITGLLLQYWFAYRFKLLPLDGWGNSVGEHAASLVLPALTLGLFGASFYARFVRDEMIGQMNRDYVRAATARGLSRWRVVLLHAMRNALVPLVTIVGMDLGALLGGAIVTEKLFRWPGIGALAVDAVVDRDGPVVMGIVLVATLAVVVMNVVVDALYAVLDPRTRDPRVAS